VRGCISDDFTLTGGRILGLKGPIPGTRTGTLSGLRADSGGLRTTQASEGVTPVNGTTGQDGDLPFVHAGAWWRLPAPTPKVTNPDKVRNYLVAGMWHLAWAARPAPSSGDLAMLAEPAISQLSRPPRASVWRPGQIQRTTVWAGALVWPYGEVLAPGQSRTLYLNATVHNHLTKSVRLEYYRLSFTGILAPTASPYVRRIGEAINASSGTTIGAALTAATATQVGSVIDEWSTP